MAKADLGTKRVCPETGKKFYDLNKDPIVSPFTGNEYPLSFFEDVAPAPTGRKAPKPAAQAEDNTEAETEAEEAQDEEEDDAPELDEEPIDMGEGDEDDETPAPKTVASDEELEGFNDEESNLDDEDDDTVLLDDGDDEIGDDIAVGDDEDET